VPCIVETTTRRPIFVAARTRHPFAAPLQFGVMPFFSPSQPVYPLLGDHLYVFGPFGPCVVAV
jgi:hypothetical protein